MNENGGPISFTTNILRSPFDASSYNDPDASRVNLSLEVDNELVDGCAELDVEILKMCKKQSKALFGKEIYIESDLKPNYYSALKQSDKYGTHLFKMKINKVGRDASRR